MQSLMFSPYFNPSTLSTSTLNDMLRDVELPTLSGNDAEIAEHNSALYDRYLQLVAAIDRKEEAKRGGRVLRIRPGAVFARTLVNPTRGVTNDNTETQRPVHWTLEVAGGPGEAIRVLEGHALKLDLRENSNGVYPGMPGRPARVRVRGIALQAADQRSAALVTLGGGKNIYLEDVEMLYSKVGWQCLRADGLRMRNVYSIACDVHAVFDQCHQVDMDITARLGGRTTEYGLGVLISRSRAIRGWIYAEALPNLELALYQTKSSDLMVWAERVEHKDEVGNRPAISCCRCIDVTINGQTLLGDRGQGDVDPVTAFSCDLEKVMWVKPKSHGLVGSPHIEHPVKVRAIGDPSASTLHVYEYSAPLEAEEVPIGGGAHRVTALPIDSLKFTADNPSAFNDPLAVEPWVNQDLFAGQIEVGSTVVVEATVVGNPQAAGAEVLVGLMATDHQGDAKWSVLTMERRLTAYLTVTGDPSAQANGLRLNFRFYDHGMPWTSGGAAEVRVENIRVSLLQPRATLAEAYAQDLLLL